MNSKRLGNIPHNTQAWFTDAEFEVARLIYVNQQRAARIAALVGPTEEGYMVTEWVPS
jgi:hypothetical protein